MTEIIQQSIEKSIDYDAYRRIIESLLSQGKSTGNHQTEALYNYSKLNHARMNRLDKKIVLSKTTIDAIASVKAPQKWVVISEGWCGDAAQALPILYKMSEVSDLIELRIVLRDENEALMNLFLTNGSQSIPKLIILDTQDEVLSSWGPRPSTATKMVTEYKELHGTLDDHFKKELQLWYNKDKGRTLQQDICDLIDRLY